MTTGAFFSDRLPDRFHAANMCDLAWSWMIDFSSPVVSGKAGAVAHGKGIKVRSTHGNSRPGLCRTTEMHCGGFSLGFGRAVL
ncbi:uncharacterized protein SEPMUDRAFT_149613 [Sphaerulina musiva SO2202]|uniref:Uncharacterized protein n=1 Tax=Sphaerulina musiva (strain SO2202) TaxID=692275 RepID=N1QKH4_SPHMS|nr:uncharacterized protein SEPMUDRAFT_149613 [Sphaerulina musiva SO2202]EMF11701.1 hypothetical protein SEPMUDRAFT_149613 [Sphaerulina musiva SO2202]